MRFYDRLITETSIDKNIKDMLRSSRLISGDNVLQYCLNHQSSLAAKMYTIPMTPVVKTIFIDINNTELLNQIDTESLGFPNKIKGIGIFSHAYEIDYNNLNLLSPLVESAYTENINAILSVSNQSRRNIVAAYMDAMKEYNIRWLLTRFAIIELESSNIILTAFMSTIIEDTGFYPKCDITSDNSIEFAAATLAYNFSLPSVLLAPRGDNVDKIHEKIENISTQDLFDPKLSCAQLIEQTPYGRFVELLNMIHSMTTGLLNCKNVSSLTLDAEQIYAGGVRRKYLRHHEHKLSDFDLLQIIKRNEAPKNTIKKGYFQTFTPERSTIGGSIGSYWCNVRESTK